MLGLKAGPIILKKKIHFLVLVSNESQKLFGGLTYLLPALFVAYSISSELPDSTLKTTTGGAGTLLGYFVLSTFGM